MSDRPHDEPRNEIPDPLPGSVEDDAADPVIPDPAPSLAAHLPRGFRFPVTITLIGINVAVFAVMVAGGVHFFSPQTADLAAWGGNMRYLTSEGEGWRVLTAAFVHAGILHLALNMFALFHLGRQLELHLDRLGLVTGYLFTAVTASLASLIMHPTSTLSVGASGAIFGCLGMQLARVVTGMIVLPPGLRMALVKRLGSIIVMNVALGTMIPAIDQSAHLGGLLAGFVFGACYRPGPRPWRWRPVLAGALATLAILACILVIPRTRDTYRDFWLAHQQLAEFEREALALLPDDFSGLDEEERKAYANRVGGQGVFCWSEAMSMLVMVEEIPPGHEPEHELFSRYCYLRELQFKTMSVFLEHGPGDDRESNFHAMNFAVAEVADQIRAAIDARGSDASQVDDAPASPSDSP